MTIKALALTIFALGAGLLLTVNAAGPGTRIPSHTSQTAPTIRAQTSTDGNLVPTPDTPKLYLVTHVIDGDTFEIANGARVRYIGINAPEIKHGKQPAQCFGDAATAYDRALIEGKYVRLTKDVSETDKYGRLLRYVYVGDTFVNQKLMTDGYARLDTFPPDVEFADTFKAAEVAARNSHLGLWASCL